MKVQRVEWHSYQLVYEYDIPDDEINNSVPLAFVLLD